MKSHASVVRVALVRDITAPPKKAKLPSNRQPLREQLSLRDMAPPKVLALFESKRHFSIVDVLSSLTWIAPPSASTVSNKLIFIQHCFTNACVDGPTVVSRSILFKMQFLISTMLRILVYIAPPSSSRTISSEMAVFHR